MLRQSASYDGSQDLHVFSVIWGNRFLAALWKSSRSSGPNWRMATMPRGCLVVSTTSPTAAVILLAWLLPSTGHPASGLTFAPDHPRYSRRVGFVPVPETCVSSGLFSLRLIPAPSTLYPTFRVAMHSVPPVAHLGQHLELQPEKGTPCQFQPDSLPVEVFF